MQSSSAVNAPIVLIGFMGSGKSSVARRLSRTLAMPLVDLDSAIEQRAGVSIAQYFAAHGENSFRRLETEVLSRSLLRSVVMATGGGVIKTAQNRDALGTAAEAGAHIVYLRAEPHTLAARIRRQPGSRPLIDGEKLLDMDATRDRVAFLLGERASHYEACATRILDTDNLTTFEVASRIAEMVSK